MKVSRLDNLEMLCAVLSFFFENILQLCVCVHVHVFPVCVGGTGACRTGVMGGYELPDVGSGNPTPVLQHEHCSPCC